MITQEKIIDTIGHFIYRTYKPHITAIVAYELAGSIAGKIAKQCNIKKSVGKGKV